MRSATTRARQVSFNLPPVLVDDRDAFVHIPGTDRAAGHWWPSSKRG
jgi:hypothetical protein